VASSWVISGANTRISNEQLESALGNEALQNIADRVGTDYETATSATAFMMPHIVDNLTPDGVVPSESDLLSRIGEYTTRTTEIISGVSAANTVDRIGTAATNIIDRDRANIGDRMGITDESQTIEDRTNITVENIDNYDDNDNSPLKWLLPLMILGLLVALGFWFCGGKTEEHKSANININTNATIII
ncbi:MAG: YidB family protein, partial [Acidobacteria bacterium]|nr:YidB family protein [Acidobacteriota bacterium]MCA1640094.1 YidB family protein [Acidobacteriota bacterium]